MKFAYRDKNGRKIEAGMTMRHDDEGLGFACNAYEAYPLHQFNLSEWEIVEEEKK